MQTDKKKLQELSCEVQRKEEWLQEERMERENLEVELGCERDRNRVSTTQSVLFQTQTVSSKYNCSRATNLHHQLLRLRFGNLFHK